MCPARALSAPTALPSALFRRFYLGVHCMVDVYGGLCAGLLAIAWFILYFEKADALGLSLSPPDTNATWNLSCLLGAGCGERFAVCVRVRLR